jgi:CheY-like chemotaxis protein
MNPNTERKMASWKKILVVDDEDDVRMFLQDFLSERDLEVHTAENGKEALEKVGKLLPDVVLLDVMMPIMDGLQCLENIKKKYPETVVIMITAFKDDARINRAKLLGAYNYIVKPFSLSYLETELMKILNGAAQA